MRFPEDVTRRIFGFVHELRWRDVMQELLSDWIFVDGHDIHRTRDPVAWRDCMWFWDHGIHDITILGGGGARRYGMRAYFHPEGNPLLWGGAPGEEDPRAGGDRWLELWAAS